MHVSVAQRIRERGRRVVVLAVLIGAVGTLAFELFDASLLEAVGIVLFLASALVVADAATAASLKQEPEAAEPQPRAEPR